MWCADINSTYLEDLRTLSVHFACKTIILQGSLSGIDCQSSAGTYSMTAQRLKDAAATHDVLCLRCVTAWNQQGSWLKSQRCGESGAGESGPDWKIQKHETLRGHGSDI